MVTTKEKYSKYTKDKREKNQNIQLMIEKLSIRKDSKKKLTKLSTKPLTINQDFEFKYTQFWNPKAQGG